MAVQNPGGPEEFTIPDALPVLPLQDAVVFPLTAVPLAVAEPRSVRLVDDVMRGNRLLALATRRNVAPVPPTPDDLHRVGTLAVINQLARMPDGSVRMMLQGIERIRLLDWIGTEPYLVARVEAAPEPVVQTAEVDGLRRAVVGIFRRLVEASPELSDDLARMRSSAIAAKSRAEHLARDRKQANDQARRNAHDANKRVHLLERKNHRLRAELLSFKERLAAAERGLVSAREILMIVETKLDILEGAAQVLDRRTRGDAAAADPRTSASM